MPAGLIVAGGRSTRFGEDDKALADVGGGPMLRHVADALAPVTDELVVNCRQEQVEAFEDAIPTHQPRFVTDLVPDEGPVVGLLAGLRAVRDSRVVVAACDQPLLRPYDLDRLVEADVGGGAVPESGGYCQPFPGVYPTTATKEACETTIGCGSRRLVEVVDRLDPVPVPTDPAACSSVDTPDDRTAVDARLGARLSSEGGY
jgi:molybdopterin-guanine dinucleotide biosynthesis protein A